MSTFIIPPFYISFFYLYIVFCCINVFGLISSMLFSSEQKCIGEVNLFKKYVTGLAIIVSFFAVIYTQGNSIFLLSLFLLFIGLASVFRRKLFYFGFNTFFHINWRAFIRNSIFLFLFYAISFYFFYIHNNSAINCDNQFYANLSTRLLATGIESPNPDWSYLPSVFPYHYFELWLGALSSYFFNIKTLQAYYLVFIPLSGVVVFQGGIALYTLISKKEKITFLGVIWGSVLLVVQGFYNFFLQIYYSIDSFIFTPKIAIVFIFYILFIILIIQKEYKLSIFSILFLVPFYTPVSPGVLSGAFFLLIYYKISHKIHAREFWRLLLLLFIVPILFFLFYYFQDNREPLFHTDISITSSILRTIKEITKLFFVGILLNVLTLILFSFCLKKKECASYLKGMYIRNKITVNAIIIFFFGGLIVLSMLLLIYFLYNHDAFQMLSIFASPLICILIFISLICIQTQLKRKWEFSIVIFFCFVLMFCVHPSGYFNMSTEKYQDVVYDKEYFEEIISEIDFSKQFAYMRNYGSNRSPMTLVPFLLFPDNRLMHILGYYAPQPISIFNIQYEYDKRYLNMENLALYKYVENLKKDESFVDINLSIISFLKEYNIKYIIVESGVEIPEKIYMNTKKVIQNKQNGNKFLILK